MEALHDTLLRALWRLTGVILALGWRPGSGSPGTVPESLEVVSFFLWRGGRRLGSETAVVYPSPSVRRCAQQGAGLASGAPLLN